MGQVVGVLADLSGLSSDAARGLHVLANGTKWGVSSFKNLTDSKNLTPVQPANVTDIKPGKYVIICIVLNV